MGFYFWDWGNDLAASTVDGLYNRTLNQNNCGDLLPSVIKLIRRGVKLWMSSFPPFPEYKVDAYGEGTVRRCFIIEPFKSDRRCWFNFVLGERGRCREHSRACFLTPRFAWGDTEQIFWALCWEVFDYKGHQLYWQSGLFPNLRNKNPQIHVHQLKK